MTMRPAAQMTDEELTCELSLLEKRFKGLREDLDEGHAGSPGEWMVERMCELETEQSRRGVR